MTYEEQINKICCHALKILKAGNLYFKPMIRRGSVNTKRSFVIGHTNLRTGSITIDIRTPKKRARKKISSILRTLCHEVAHHQKMPYKQRYKGRWIIRQHYPEFYEQVTKNIELLKQDCHISKYFSKQKRGERPQTKSRKKGILASILAKIS